MKHLEHGRANSLAGKRKSNKPSKKHPNARRQQLVALRKKTRADNLRKREHTLAKIEAAAIAHGEKPAEVQA